MTAVRGRPARGARAAAWGAAVRALRAAGPAVRPAARRSVFWIRLRSTTAFSNEVNDGRGNSSPEARLVRSRALSRGRGRDGRRGAGRRSAQLQRGRDADRRQPEQQLLGARSTDRRDRGGGGV